MGYLASGCSGLAHREYQKRLDRMGLWVYLELCCKYGAKCATVWFNEVPAEIRVSDNGKVEIWSDRSVNTGNKHNCSDSTVLNQAAQEWTFVDFWCHEMGMLQQKGMIKLPTFLPWLRRSERCIRYWQKLFCWWLVVWVWCHTNWRDRYPKEHSIPDVLRVM